MKVGIIGSGFVGSTAAYAMVMRGVCREIVLVDLNRKRAEAEADDLLHAVPFAHPVNIHAGDYPDLKNCKVVILTAGVSQKPGETRLELLSRNARVFESIVPQILEHAPDCLLLVATNPVDIMTHITSYYASKHGIPSSMVIGSGTTLDTARFRALLGRQLGVDSQHVHAYVIGEHGDSEVLPWSLVTIGGIPLEEYCRMCHLDICAEDRDEIESLVRNAAYQIIEGKGSTYYGIGSALARIVEVINKDQRSILTVCTPDKLYDYTTMTLSLPRLVGGEGIIETLHPPLNPGEEEALRSSANIIHDVIEELDGALGV